MSLKDRSGPPCQSPRHGISTRCRENRATSSVQISRAGALRSALLSATLLAERKATFLMNRRMDVVTMREALDRSDFSPVAFLSHGMRGAGGMFGFPAITEIGAALEESADRLDRPASCKWVEELSRCLDRAGAAA